MAVSIAGIKTATKASTKTEKPTIPDPDGQLTEALLSGIEAARDIDAANTVLLAAKGKLTMAASAYAWTALNGRHDPEDTFQVACASGKALVSMKNKYKLPENLDAIRELVPARFIREQVAISVDITEVPEDAQQAFLDSLVNTAKQFDELYGVESFSQAITAKVVTVISKAFHAERHTILTPEQNAELHRIMPCEISVRLDH